MVYIGYVFTILNYICYCTSRFAKQKKNILLLDTLAKFFTIIALFCLNSLTGSYNMFVSILLLITANYKERHLDKFSKPKLWTLYLFFQFLYSIILLFTINGISSILVFFTSSISLLCIWWLPPQQMRLIGIFNNVVYLIYQISIQNWAGILEIFVIISNITSFAKYRKEPLGLN